jgi:hypothetical protein
MMFGALSDRFGWTVSQIGELTLDQVDGYTCYMAEHPRVPTF